MIAAIFILLQTLLVDAQMDQTRVTLVDYQPEIAPDELIVTYDNLAWSHGEWVDLVAMDTIAYSGQSTFTLPAILKPQSTIRVYEEEYSDDEEDIVAEADISSERAFAMRIVTTTTTRGEQHRNEMFAPDSASRVEDYSVPLEVLFECQVTPNGRYRQWVVSEYGLPPMPARIDESIRHTFYEYGTSWVKLTVTNDFGDRLQDSVKVTTKESLLRVPNVFTPNGDGKNDEFRVLYRSLKEYHIWIYNRWNKLVYESTDPSRGWDGRIGGKVAAEGAYYYVIRAVGNDRDEQTKRPRHYKLSGAVNLITGGLDGKNEP